MVPSNSISWFRAFLGASILILVTMWVINKGELTERLSFETLFWSTLISLPTGLMQALTLTFLAQAFQRELKLRFALRISSLCSLSNAAGGLPLGTTLKYAVLYSKVGISLSQITFGLSIYTVGISIVLVVYAILGMLALNFQPLIKIISVVVLLCGIAFIFLLVRFSTKYRITISRFILPFLKRPTSIITALICFIIASLFTLNSVIVGLFLFPEHSVFHIMFLSASGILLGAASLLQSVGGVQEIAMGFSAYLAGIDSIDGVQIALVMRFTSIVSSGIILALSYILPEHGVDVNTV